MAGFIQADLADQSIVMGKIAIFNRDPYSMAGGAISKAKRKSKLDLDLDVLLKAYELMQTSKRMAETYDEHREICSKYVHSTSRGHEAIQLAVGLQLKP